MSDFYDGIEKRARGAWAIHHAQKTAATVNGSAEFSALDTAGKAASLLSQLAASDQITIEKTRVDALAKAAGLNARLEVPALLDLLEGRRLISRSSRGDVEILGLSSSATVGHAADLFDDLDPTEEERAAIALSEVTSSAPQSAARVVEFIGDEFKLSKPARDNLIERSEVFGFVDAEGAGADKLFFNGNLFRRDNLAKTARVLGSLSSQESALITSIDQMLASKGCMPVGDVEHKLGLKLFEKLMAAGMYDVNMVANNSGEFGFVTRPSAFHKFNDPVADDAFDLAKALVAALTFGMTQSESGRGKIEMIGALLRKLISGGIVGPATAIGEDYRVLEHKGVLKLTPGPKYGFLMKLLKKDVGEMALAVLTTGDTAADVVDRPLPGVLNGYTGPERTRSQFRNKKQTPPSRKDTFDVLSALRTGGL
jgi:hypothetical protein